MKRFQNLKIREKLILLILISILLLVSFFNFWSFPAQTAYSSGTGNSGGFSRIFDELIGKSLSFQGGFGQHIRPLRSFNSGQFSDADITKVADYFSPDKSLKLFDGDRLNMSELSPYLDLGEVGRREGDAIAAQVKEKAEMLFAGIKQEDVSQIRDKEAKNFSDERVDDDSTQLIDKKLAKKAFPDGDNIAQLNSIKKLLFGVCQKDSNPPFAQEMSQIPNPAVHVLSQIAQLRCKEANTPFNEGSGLPIQGIDEGEDRVSFVARYYCPQKTEDFDPIAENGISGSAIVVDKSGISITRAEPFDGYDFHEKGCLLSFSDPVRFGTMQMYQAYPKFFRNSGKMSKLLYLVPAKPYTKHGKVFGIESAVDRVFRTLGDYEETRKELCQKNPVNDRSNLSAYGFPISRKTELERKLARRSGRMLGDLESFTITPTSEHQGFSGGALVTEDEKKCFVGNIFIKKEKYEFLQTLVSAKTIHDFLNLTFSLLPKS